MDETQSAAGFGVAAGAIAAASAPGARSAVGRASDTFSGPLLGILSLQAAAFALLMASGKIPGVVLVLFRALLTF